MSHEAPQIMEKGWCVVEGAEAQLDPKRQSELVTKFTEWAGGEVLRISTDWVGNRVQHEPFGSEEILGVQERLFVRVSAVGEDGKKSTKTGILEQGTDGSIVNKQELGLPDDLDPELIWTLGGVQREWNRFLDQTIYAREHGLPKPADNFVHISREGYAAQLALLAQGTPTTQPLAA
ncbi:MAG: hypothetical protein WBP03_05595 [Candidatus Saccharimonadales bacterium]